MGCIHSPEMTKGQFTRSFWNNLCGSPTACRQGCWPNQEAKFARASRQEKVQGGLHERLVGNVLYGVMHACIVASPCML